MNYKNPDYILPLLSQAEMAYVMLFSLCNNGYFDLDEEEFIGSSVSDDDEPSSEFDFTWSVKDPDGEPFMITISGSFSGYTTEGSAGSYWDPPEAGDTYIDSLDAGMIYIQTPETDFEVTKEMVEKEGFSYKDMILMAEKAAYIEIEYDFTKYITDRMKTAPTGIPRELEEKMEKLDNDPILKKRYLARKIGLL